MRATRIIGEHWKQASTLTSPNRPSRPSWRRWSRRSRGGHRAAPNEFRGPVEAREDNVAWCPRTTLELVSVVRPTALAVAPSRRHPPGDAHGQRRRALLL